MISVDVDWSLSRDQFRVSTESGEPVFYASGYPRSLPGVSVSRNLNGISFAVANMTGFVARALEDCEERSLSGILNVLALETQQVAG